MVMWSFLSDGNYLPLSDKPCKLTFRATINNSESDNGITPPPPQSLNNLWVDLLNNVAVWHWKDKLTFTLTLTLSWPYFEALENYVKSPISLSCNCSLCMHIHKLNRPEIPLVSWNVFKSIAFHLQTFLFSYSMVTSFPSKLQEIRAGNTELSRLF